MRRTSLFIVMWSLASLAPALAQSTDRGRFYAGVALGNSSVDGRSQAASTISFSPGVLPSSLSVNGLPFDDDDAAWSAFMGFAATRYVGVELGYWDHGRFKSELRATTERPSLAINELYFGATLTYPLTQRLALTGSAGVSRARFDVQGEVTVAVIGPPSGAGIPTLPLPVFPPGTGIVGFGPVPFATPKDETGGYWRVGLNWRFSDRVDAGLSYGRRDLQVQEVETVALSMVFAF